MSQNLHVVNTNKEEYLLSVILILQDVIETNNTSYHKIHDQCMRIETTLQNKEHTEAALNTILQVAEEVGKDSQ